MSLLLRNTPGEWDGTFAVVAEKMIRDLLEDGAIPVIVNGEGSLRTLTGYEAGTLMFSGYTLSLDDINEIEVP